MVGIVMAIVHHEFYAYLDRNKVNADFWPYSRVILPALGTFVAYIAHRALAAAIGEYFGSIFALVIGDTPSNVSTLLYRARNPH